MPQPTQQAVLVDGGTRRTNELTLQLELFDASGNGLIIPKQAAAQTDAAALTSAAATGGDAPTEAEYNALRTDVSNLRTTVNSLLGKMRTAKQLAP